MKQLAIIILSMLGTMLLVAHTTAQSLYVGPGEDYETISDALNAVSDGDTIIVRDGVYDEDLYISKSVTLLADNLHQAVIGNRSGPEGVVNIGATDGVSNVTVKGFRLDSINGLGFLIGYTDFSTSIEYPASNCTIENNIIDGRLFGVVVSTLNDSITIKGNVITSSKRYGMSLSGRGILNVIDNEISDSDEGSGLRILNTFEGKALLTNNVSKRNGLDGFELRGSNIRVDGNELSDNYRNGMLIRDGANNIEIVHGNEIGQNLFSGIFIQFGSDTILIDSNLIQLNVQHGIHLNAPATITRNVIYQNNNLGIMVNSDAMIGENLLSGNINNGIETSADPLQVIISNNTIRDCPAGLVLRCPATVTDNVFEDIYLEGIYTMSQTSGITINDNQFNRIGNTGILIEGSALIADNSFHNITEYGVHIRSAIGIVSVLENEFYNNSNAIYTQSLLTTPFIRGNTIQGSYTGLQLESPAVVRGNSITLNNIGVEVQSFGVDLGQDEIDENGNNIIADNAEWNLINPTSNIVEAYWNDWGLYNEMEIDATILDDDEDGSFGKVFFTPFTGWDPSSTTFPDQTPLPMTLSPNPVSEVLSIEYLLPYNTWVMAEVHDERGKLIYRFPDIEQQTAGLQTMTWSVDKTLPNGIYHFHILTNRQRFTGKVIVLK